MQARNCSPWGIQLLVIVQYVVNMSMEDSYTEPSEVERCCMRSLKSHVIKPVFFWCGKAVHMYWTAWLDTVIEYRHISVLPAAESTVKENLIFTIPIQLLNTFISSTLGWEQMEKNIKDSLREVAYMCAMFSLKEF